MTMVITALATLMANTTAITTRLVNGETNIFARAGTALLVFTLFDLFLLPIDPPVF